MILDQNGNPIKQSKDPRSHIFRCPSCGQGKESLEASSGFGSPWTVCKCGKEFKEIPWQLVSP